MTHRYADRVMVLSSSQGTGDMLLGQAVAGYQDFAEAGFVIGDTCDLCIEDPIARVWETVRVTLTAADTIARGTIFDSSAGGARIDFGEGVKRLYIVQPGQVIAEDRTATESARDEVASLITGFADTVAGATQEALDLVAETVAGIVVDSGVATAAATDAQAAAGAAQLSAGQAASAAGQAFSASADADAAAVAAAAAADSTAAAVANAAVQRETLAALQAVVGAEGQLGVVYGANVDRGQYRYRSGAWVYDGPTIPDLSDRVDAAASAILRDPAEEAVSLIVRDDTGAVGLELTPSQLRTAGGRLKRNDDGSVSLERLDGGSVAVTIHADHVAIGDAQHRAAPADVLWAVADEAGFGVIVVRADGSVQVNGTWLMLASDGTSQLRDAQGREYLKDGAPLGGAVFSEAALDGIAYAVADEYGFIAFAVKANGETLASGIEGSGGATGEGFSDLEIAERNTRNLAFAMQVRGQGNERMARPVWNYCHVISWGQSLSTGVESWPALTTYQPFPGLLTWGGSVRPASGASATWTPYTDTSFHQLVATVTSGGVILDAAAQAALPAGDGASGETPMEAMLVSFRRAMNNQLGVEDDPTRKFVATACGVGNNPLSSFVKGGALYPRVASAATGVKGVATSLGGTYGLLAMIWLQGENDYTDGTTKESYKDGCRQMVADIRADTQEGVAGQSRPFVFLTYQTGAAFTVDTLDLAIGQAQLELALEEPNWYLACPIYPVTDKGGHIDPNGSRWVGEQFGKVMTKLLLRGEGWRPVYPTELAWRGREVLISYHVPEPPLVFAAPYVVLTATDYAAKGFSAKDDSGAVTISNAEVVADTVVRLTLARDVVGTLRISYATKATFNGNGCVRDSDPTMSFFDYEYHDGSGQYAGANIPALVDQPYPLHNWSVAFSYAATEA